MRLAEHLCAPARPSLATLGLRCVVLVAACVGVGWIVREEVLVRQLGTLRQESLHRVEFYRQSLEALLSRHESLPRVIALEARLKALLLHPTAPDAQLAANRYLLDIKNGAGLNAAYLIDRHGQALAASNFRQGGSYVGSNYAYRPYLRAALDGKLGIFYGIGTTTGDAGYFLAAPIDVDGEIIGAATVKVCLEDFESALARSGDTVLLVDANGVIFLSSVAPWKYRTLRALAPETQAQLALTRQYNKRPLAALETPLPLHDDPQLVRTAVPDLAAQDYLVQSKKSGALGWAIVLLTPTRQERQNALLAGIAAGFATAFALSTLIYLRHSALGFRRRRQAEAALRQAHQELEQRLGERTADLRATNASLEEKIDRLKTAESILRETSDQAVQAGKLAVLGQMAAGITHEVNQPLTALHTFSDNAIELLERGRLAEVGENLGLIKQMAMRMGHIIGQIKSFARKPALERSSIRVADVIAQARMMVEPRLQRIGGRIDVDFAAADAHFEADAQRVWADPQRLEQVLVNLLINAIDALAERSDKRIEITVGAVSAPVKQVCVTLRDSGAGIPPSVMAHLFEPFFTTKAAGRGLGLGLPISRLIINELGGRIEAGNHPSGGAQFSVFLEAA